MINIKIFLILQPENFIPENIRNFLGQICFIIFELGISSSSFLKKKKKKMRQYGCDLYKISQEIKRINWFSVEKLIIEREKTLYYNYKKVKFCFFITKSIRKFLLLRLRFKRNIRIFLFSCLASSFLKYKRLFKLSTRKFRFLKY